MNKEQRPESIGFTWFGQRHRLYYRSEVGEGRPLVAVTAQELRMALDDNEDVRVQVVGELRPTATAEAYKRQFDRAEAAEAKVLEVQRDACRMHYLGNLIRQREQSEQDELTRLMRKYPPRVAPLGSGDDGASNMQTMWKALARANGVAFRDAHEQLARAEAKVAELTEQLAVSESAIDAYRDQRERFSTQAMESRQKATDLEQECQRLRGQLEAAGSQLREREEEMQRWLAHLDHCSLDTAAFSECERHTFGMAFARFRALHELKFCPLATAPIQPPPVPQVAEATTWLDQRLALWRVFAKREDDWFLWASRDSEDDARVAITGLGAGHETLLRAPGEVGPGDGLCPRCFSCKRSWRRILDSRMWRSSAPCANDWHNSPAQGEREKLAGGMGPDLGNPWLEDMRDAVCGLDTDALPLHTSIKRLAEFAAATAVYLNTRHQAELERAAKERA